MSKTECANMRALSRPARQVYPAQKRLRRYRVVRPPVCVEQGDDRQPQQVGPVEREAVQERGDVASPGGRVLSTTPTARPASCGTTHRLSLRELLRWC